LEQLSALSGRERRDITPPDPGPRELAASLAAAYAAQQPQYPLVPVEAGDRWSLGDLLARASRDEDGTQRMPSINIEVIARAVDATTASAIWSRFRAGQRGIMVRSIYTAEGRASFDEISERYGTDPGFKRMVDRFLLDFESLLRGIEQKDPSGRAVHN